MKDATINYCVDVDRLNDRATTGENDRDGDPRRERISNVLVVKRRVKMNKQQTSNENEKRKESRQVSKVQSK